MHTLPPLPYALDALAPYISQETLEFHSGKHHQTYVDNLNKLIVGTEFENMTLVEIIQKSPKGPIFNNAAQIWNHTFYFEGLSGSENDHIIPTSLEQRIVDTWGSIEKFQSEFTQMALANFGSGWTWLAIDPSEKLEIINTSNAETLLTRENTPLLICDIWEHAYYIDYRNARAKYMENFWHIINWKQVAERMS